MGVKSVIDIEVNDEAFKDFAAIFEKYRVALGETPGVWAASGKAAAGTAASVENLVAGLLTHEAINRKIAREEAEKSRQLERQQRIMRGFAPTFKEVAKSVASITASIFKWSSIGTLTGGLLGYGGLLGLDRLASGVGAGRRSSQGLGATYGEEKAFENTYSRLVDPKAFLSGVSEAMTDVTKRAALYGAGMTGKDFEGKSTGAVANDLLPLLKRLVDRTPDGQLANVLTARRLDQFISLEDARRLKKTSSAELAEFRGQYGAKVGGLGLEDALAKKWQDFGVQLDSAKLKIEAVFVRGLEPLVKPLGDLSESVANALKFFLEGLDPKALKDIGKGIEAFGKYLGSPEFRTDLKEFANNVSYASKKIVDALRWLGMIPDNSPGAVASRDRVKALVETKKPYSLQEYADAKFGKTDENRPARWYDPGSWLSGKGGIGEKLNEWSGQKRLLGAKAVWNPRPNDSNPGNIRMPGRPTGFAQFATAGDGIRAIANQLRLYVKRDKLDTIDKIIAKYAPAGDKNDVGAYARHVSKLTGIKRDAKIDANDPVVIAKVVAAITKHEGRKAYSSDEVLRIISGKPAPEKVSEKTQVVRDRERVIERIRTPAPAARKTDVPATRSAPAGPAKPARVEAKITINNNTGGSAVVQQSQVAKQG